MQLKKCLYLHFLGQDWEWSNQDGGAGNIGAVLSLDNNGVVRVCTLQTSMLYYK